LFEEIRASELEFALPSNFEEVSSYQLEWSAPHLDLAAVPDDSKGSRRCLHGNHGSVEKNAAIETCLLPHRGVRDHESSYLGSITS
jgi:hypothetical protein